MSSLEFKPLKFMSPRILITTLSIINIMAASLLRFIADETAELAG